MTFLLRTVARASANPHLLRAPQVTRQFSVSPSSLEKRSAIVTGSSRGIGKAIALRLANDGYDVCVNDIEANKQGAEEVAHEISQMGRKACVALADVSKLEEVDKMVQTSVSELGDLNTMVANAGIAQAKPALELTPEDWERMFQVNVFGVNNSYASAARQLIAQQTCTPSAPGKLIAASSIVGFKAFAQLAHYSASKWAVRGLNQAYAMELAAQHITANTYAPGIVGTAMWEMLDAELGKRSGAEKGETMRRYSRELIALGRTSTGQDVARLVGFLASHDADYVTGQTQLVDGGMIFT